MCRDVAPMAIVLLAHKTTCTAETTDAYDLAIMCNAVRMHKKLTWMNTHSSVNTHDATHLSKTICMINTWNAF